nr:beta-mannosidase [Rhodococcus sp. UNC23MFCrub1.1]
MVGCAHAAPPSSAAPTPPRVGATASGLTLDSRPWYPTGFDAYQLATNWSVNLGCGAMVDLDRYFSSLPPNSLTRFNAFQSLAIDRTTGMLNFAPIDAVFEAARVHGQLVVPVLTAQDGACEDEKFKDRIWYTDGWRSVADTSAIVSFEDWVGIAVERWRDEPSLAAWETVGEPETSVCGQTCDWTDRSCPSDAAAVLRAFTDASGAVVRSTDTATPITAGLTGGGQCGTQGDEYGLIAASPHVDILQYHDYGADGVALPGDQWNGLARRLDQASDAGKPLVVAEIGQAAGSCLDPVERADDIDTKVDGQRAAGSAGFLLWAFVPDPRPNECTFDIGYDDPLWSVVQSHGSG